VTKRVFVIAGSRDYPANGQVERELDKILQRDDVVITGGARGVDTAATARAREIGCRLVVMTADWAQYGKRAGMIRNRAMLERLVKARFLKWETMVVCFWANNSPGTRNTMMVADELMLDLVVFVPERC